MNKSYFNCIIHFLSRQDKLFFYEIVKFDE